ncbi:MAG: hypothetical protein AAF589_02455 [Planctomycetota bacterium]
MRSAKLLTALIGLGAAGLLLMPALADDDPTAPSAPAAAPDPPMDAGVFADKVAVIYVQNALPEDGIMMRDAAFQRVGGRWFLTGQSPDLGDPEDWMADTPVMVDWSRVESFNLLTERQFQQRVVEEGGGGV